MMAQLAGSVFFLVAAVMAQDAKPNFTGTWQVKNYEIDRIDHREPVFRISPAVGRAHVVHTYEFRTDGSQLKSTAYPSGEIERSAHWEGDNLVLVTRTVANGVTSTKSETLFLVQSGTVLVKHIHVSEPGKEYNDVLRFDKISDGIRGIKMGDSEAVVRHEWGEPDSIEHRGGKTIYIYQHQEAGPLEVIFVEGKMTDSMARKSDKEAPKADP